MTFPFVMPMSGLIGGGGAASLSFSLRASATTSASSIVTPGSTVAGDLLIFAEYARNTDAAVAPTSVIPTGFTQIGSSLSATAGTEGFRLNVAYKIATGADAGTSRTGMNDNHMAKVMLVFNPGATIVTTTLSTPNAEITAGDPALQTVSASGQPAPLLVFAAIGSPISGYGYTTISPGFDSAPAASGTSASMILGYNIYNSSPANHSINISDSGAMNAVTSWYMRFT